MDAGRWGDRRRRLKRLGQGSVQTSGAGGSGKWDTEGRGPIVYLGIKAVQLACSWCWPLGTGIWYECGTWGNLETWLRKWCALGCTYRLI